ncbi:MAG: manganese efflux pump MntP family protein [Clostridia bacterium]
MSWWEIVLVGLGVAADAFAVSVCKGLYIKQFSWKKAVIVGCYFGLFQAAMPLIGYFIGAAFSKYIITFDHWVAFALLGLIGGRMIFDAVKKDRECAIESEEAEKRASLAFKSMVALAFATSIDALTVGITFSFLPVNIYAAIAIIGIITFAMCVAGVKLGSVFGKKLRFKAEIVGGIILILVGVKILIEHLIAT